MPPAELPDAAAGRPTLYLDQWVWVRMAKVRAGRPARPGDVDLLSAVQDAAEAGVVLPLSSTHYMETLRVKDPRQRRDLADTMAPLSACRTLRRTRDLVTHQMRAAFHEQFGRPTFRPAPCRVFGLGAHWAFTGQERRLQLTAPGAQRLRDDPALARRCNQHAEYQLLAGPSDHDVAALREAGYRPEWAEESGRSRLEWERVLSDLLADGPLTRGELRVAVMARELVHEHLEDC